MKELGITAKPPMDKAGLAGIEKLLAAMEQIFTAPATSILRKALADPYLALTRAYASRKEPEKAITTG